MGSFATERLLTDGISIQTSQTSQILLAHGVAKVSRAIRAPTLGSFPSHVYPGRFGVSLLHRLMLYRGSEIRDKMIGVLGHTKPGGFCELKSLAGGDPSIFNDVLNSSSLTSMTSFSDLHSDADSNDWNELTSYDLSLDECCGMPSISDPPEPATLVPLESIQCHRARITQKKPSKKSSAPYGRGIEALRAAQYHHYDTLHSPSFLCLHVIYKEVTRSKLIEVSKAILETTPQGIRLTPLSRHQRRVKGGMLRWLDDNLDALHSYILRTSNCSSPWK
jgi:hypothetical protein